MIVLVCAEDESVELVEVEEFNTFAVSVPDNVSGTQLDTTLRQANWGEIEGRQAWIRADAIVKAATQNGCSDKWFEKFNQMVDYANKKGWWRGKEGTIRAHLEYR